MSTWETTSQRAEAQTRPRCVGSPTSCEKGILSGLTSSSFSQTFESMPIYVRIGMHLLYSEHDSELLGMKRIKALLKEQSIA